MGSLKNGGQTAASGRGGLEERTSVRRGQRGTRAGREESPSWPLSSEALEMSLGGQGGSALPWPGLAGPAHVASSGSLILSDPIFKMGTYMFCCPVDAWGASKSGRTQRTIKAQPPCCGLPLFVAQGGC